MIKKSLLALLLAYLICVIPPVIMHHVFADHEPPSDSYASVGSYHMGLYGQLLMCAVILLLFAMRKIVNRFFKIDEVIYFHFLFYLFFYNAVNVFFILQSRKSEMFYTISGARKIKDPVYGYIYPPNSQRHETVMYSDSLLLTATYTFDTFGRRYTPQKFDHKHISTLFFGCSFTYGDGVNDAETLPSQYAALDTISNVYNYALDGWGPQQTLQQLTHRDLVAETHSDTALGIYVWIDDHLRRAALFKSHYLGWTQYFPCFILDKDSLIYKGNFEKVFPLKGLMFELMDHGIFFRNMDIPSQETAADYELSCAILKESQKAFQHQFRSGKFIVFLYPGYGSELIPYLKKAKIEYILADKNELTPSDFIPRHGHPNKYANQKLAGSLFLSLSNYHETSGI